MEHEKKVQQFKSDYARFMEEARHRRTEILRLRAKKWTLQEIGDKYHITAERVRQILVSAKSKKADGKKDESGQKLLG